MDETFGEKYIRKVVDGEENPFWTLEALQEHVQMLWGLLAKQGVDVWEKDEHGANSRPKGKPGTMTYHLRAVDDYAQKLFNGFSALDHVLYRASDDNVTVIEKEELKRDLKRRAEKYAEYWSGK